ncbi:MAG TPA: M23 family metallopeptidase, partial [Gemmatimonadales bacterium]|nr:M23 family metallopeptidase [Gemmatimonadales bacterium]
MAKRRWTVVFVPHGSEPSKIIEVSYGLIKTAIGGAALGLTAALLVGYATMARTADLSRTAHLQDENSRLAQEIGELHGRLSSLSDTLSRISQRDARIRVLANLEPIDPQVQAAGIGGPTLASRPGLLNAGPTVRRSEEIRVDLNALIRRANLLASSFEEAKDSLASHSQRLAATPSIMPTQGWLTSAFSSMREHPILHIARPHEGIDVTAPMGSPIEAPAAGVVTDAGWESGYGNTVTIDHGYGIVTKFAHASKLLVKRGQRVQRGQRIALVGNTGLATGPHLHYEVHVNGRPVDPLKYVL